MNPTNTDGVLPSSKPIKGAGARHNRTTRRRKAIPAAIGRNAQSTCATVSMLDSFAPYLNEVERQALDALRRFGVSERELSSIRSGTMKTLPSRYAKQERPHAARRIIEDVAFLRRNLPTFRCADNHTALALWSVLWSCRDIGRDMESLHLRSRLAIDRDRANRVNHIEVWSECQGLVASGAVKNLTLAVEHVAERRGLSPRTIFRWFADLERRGVISPY